MGVAGFVDAEEPSWVAEAERRRRTASWVGGNAFLNTGLEMIELADGCGRDKCF